VIVLYILQSSVFGKVNNLCSKCRCGCIIPWADRHMEQKSCVFSEISSMVIPVSIVMLKIEFDNFVMKIWWSTSKSDVDAPSQTNNWFETVFQLKSNKHIQKLKRFHWTDTMSWNSGCRWQTKSSLAVTAICLLI
jgi:hypothetical protein